MKKVKEEFDIRSATSLCPMKLEVDVKFLETVFSGVSSFAKLSINLEAYLLRCVGLGLFDRLSMSSWMYLRHTLQHALGLEPCAT
jgi:hypothetical protein